MIDSFFKRTNSKILPLVIGYAFLSVELTFIGFTGVFNNSPFFNWGPPFTMAGVTIESQIVFYFILSGLFIKQFTNSWISSTVYPFIVNEIQNDHVTILKYPKYLSLLIVFANDLYSQIYMIIFFLSMQSQISFALAIILGTVVPTTITGYGYLRKKSILPEEYLV